MPPLSHLTFPDTEFTMESSKDFETASSKMEGVCPEFLKCM